MFMLWGAEQKGPAASALGSDIDAHTRQSLAIGIELWVETPWVGHEAQGVAQLHVSKHARVDDYASRAVLVGLHVMECRVDLASFQRNFYGAANAASIFALHSGLNLGARRATESRYDDDLGRVPCAHLLAVGLER
jgi:hypothetical protein